MDKTEQYIKMCEEAEEIQGLKHRRDEYRDWDSGDFYSYNGEVNVFEGWAFSEGAIEGDIKTGNCIWLPRQDQLQEMVVDKEWSLYETLHYLIEWMSDPWGYGEQPYRRHWDKLRKWGEYIKSLTSMEQLWLAFVMKGKYNKTWDGSEWVE